MQVANSIYLQQRINMGMSVDADQDFVSVPAKQYLNFRRILNRVRARQRLMAEDEHRSIGCF